MKLLVLGATGGTGREIVRLATAAGHDVTALVRDQTDASRPLPGAHLIEGDARDETTMRRAVAGQNAVASALGSAASGPFRRVTMLSDATRALVAAMEGEGVRRLVCISGIGAGDSRGHGGFIYDRLIQPLALRGVSQDKDRQESLIRASNLDWVIVRPSMLQDGPATGRIRAFTDLHDFHGGKIRRTDVAAFVVGQLTIDNWLRQTPLITG